ncbi:hypothetical protein [Variovorax davisae]
MARRTVTKYRQSLKVAVKDGRHRVAQMNRQQTSTT